MLVPAPLPVPSTSTAPPLAAISRVRVDDNHANVGITGTVTAPALDGHIARTCRPNYAVVNHNTLEAIRSRDRLLVRLDGDVSIDRLKTRTARHRDVPACPDGDRAIS